jgi:hypothetical protein
MHVCATLGSSGNRLREKYTKQKYQSHKIVMFHVCLGTPLSNRLQWKFALFFKGHQPNQSRHFWWLYVKRFGFSEGPYLGRKLTRPLQQCLALPRRQPANQQFLR